MNNLTLTDAELRLALRFVLRGAKGSYRDVLEHEELTAQALVRKVLDAVCQMAPGTPLNGSGLAQERRMKNIKNERNVIGLALFLVWLLGSFFSIVEIKKNNTTRLLQVRHKE